MPQRTGDEDELLVASFRKGDEKAFDEVFRRFYVPLSYFAFHLIQDRAQAEDIVQDCFVSLWKRRKKLSHIESIKNYLYTSVRYQCLKHIQRKKGLHFDVDDLTADISVEPLIIAAETANELYKHIENLSPRLRDVIKLFYLEGKSYQEIAKILQIDAKAARQRRLRGILELRKIKISLS